MLCYVNNFYVYWPCVRWTPVSDHPLSFTPPGGSGTPEGSCLRVATCGPASTSPARAMSTPCSASSAMEAFWTYVYRTLTLNSFGRRFNPKRSYHTAAAMCWACFRA